MFAWLGKGLSALGNRIAGPAQPSAAYRAAVKSIIQARYDSAQNTQENSRRWVGVDLYSARAANSFNVRRQLRIRSRYCRDNNSFFRGIVRNKTNHLFMGTGPTPKVKGPDVTGNKRIEAGWKAWWKAVGGLKKLKVMAQAKLVDGEGFFVLQTNKRVNHSVQLYPHDIEADQVTTPQPLNLDESFTDGIILDEFSNPLYYTILKSHPGDFLFPNLNPLDSRKVRADYVIQWFQKDRPGQVRGIPEMTAALELFEQMRTFRMATLTAAEAAALLSVVLESVAPADPAAYTPSPMQAINFERGQMLETPGGYKASQLTAEHPNTTYEVFVYCLLAEACRCIGVPLNVALGTSQKFNFSSARLDHMDYRDGLVIDRQDCNEVVMDRLFRAYTEEAVMIPGLLPDGATPETIEVDWHWPGWAYLDPQKDALADTERLTKNRTMTYEQFFAEQGKDWEEQFEQFAAEREKLEELGLDPLDAAPAKPGFGGDSSEEEGADAQAQAA